MNIDQSNWSRFLQICSLEMSFLNLELPYYLPEFDYLNTSYSTFIHRKHTKFQFSWSISFRDIRLIF